jgi:hypothetical protein
LATLASNQKRAFLRSIARAAVGAGVSLLDGLNAFQDRKYNAFEKAGGFVTSSSGNGYAATIQATVGGLSPDELLDLSEELLSIYDSAKQTLIDDGTATPNDAEILAGMLNHARLPEGGVQNVYSDFSQLRQGGASR